MYSLLTNKQVKTDENLAQVRQISNLHNGNHVVFFKTKRIFPKLPQPGRVCASLLPKRLRHRLEHRHPAGFVADPVGHSM